MDKRATELLAEIKAGKRSWRAPGETKDVLVRFQRDVVIPLRHLAGQGVCRLIERAETYRGARFITSVTIADLTPSREPSGPEVASHPGDPGC